MGRPPNPERARAVMGVRAVAARIRDANLNGSTKPDDVAKREIRVAKQRENGYAVVVGRKTPFVASFQTNEAAANLVSRQIQLFIIDVLITDRRERRPS